MILTSIVITSLFYIREYPKIIPVLFMTVGFGIIGFLDDYHQDCDEAFRRAESEAEAAGADRDHWDLYLLPDAFRRGWHDGADPFTVGLTTVFPGSGGAVYPVCICRGAGYGQRREFYGRLRRSVYQRYDPGGDVYDDRGPGGKERHQPDTGAVVGSLAGFLLFNVYPARYLWGIPVLWLWEGLCRQVRL